jgi:hypothetical protein
MTGREPRDAAALSAAEKEILATIRSLKFGSVEVVIHNARIVRVERHEKVRIEEDAP